VNHPGLLQRQLAVLGRFVARRSGTVLVSALLVTVVAAPLALHTLRNRQHDLLEVLTKGMPKAEAFKRIGHDFGIIDRHFVVLGIESRDDLPLARHFADRLVELLAADPGVVRTARCRMDLMDFFLKHAYIYYDQLNDDLRAELSGKFSDQGLRRAMATNRELLRAMAANRQMVSRDPLQLRDLGPKLRAWARRRFGTEAGIDPEGYFVAEGRNEDGRPCVMLLVDVQPAKSSADRVFRNALMEHTGSCIARTRAELFNAKGPGNAAAEGRLTAEIGGAYALAQSMEQLIGAGILRGAIISFLLIVGFFAASYRRPGAVIFVGLPLVLPVIWTLALAQVPLYLFGYEGRVSIVGLAFCAVLLGLGVDYAIHIYNRYVTERVAGADPCGAAQTSLAATGEGIVIGATTTVIAFAGMTLTDFRGFKEFGAMAALGVFLTMVALLLCMPAALTLLARWRGDRERTRQPLSFGLDLALCLVRAHPGLLVIGGLVALALSVAAMFVDPAQEGVNFESDIGKMGPPKRLDTVGQLNRRVAEAFRIDYKQISVIVSGKSAAQVLERTSRLVNDARGAERVRAVRGVTDLVPALSHQKKSLALARSQLFPELANLETRMNRAASAAGLNPKALGRSEHYRRFLDTVRTMTTSLATGKQLDPEHPPDPLIAELVGFMFRPPDPGKGGLYRTHTLISLREYRGMESEDYAQLAQALGVNGKTVAMTSYVLIVYELKDSVESDLILVTGAVAGIVLLMLLCALRRPIYVLLALSPVVMGAAFMLVVMKAASKIMGMTGCEFVLDLNYINVLVFPLLIGIGVDNAVHLIIRARQDGMDISGAVTETGRAMVLCSLTTMLGFLSLTTCPHWGIRSLGIVVAIGMGFVMLVSAIFVPAALELLHRRKTQSSQPS